MPKSREERLGHFFMPEIHCHNINLNQRGQSVECGRFLGYATKEQMEALKDTGGVMYYRCPACKPECRWIAIYYSNGFVFRSMNKKPDVGFHKMKFDRIIASEQVG